MTSTILRSALIAATVVGAIHGSAHAQTWLYSHGPGGLPPMMMYNSPAWQPAQPPPPMQFQWQNSGPTAGARPPYGSTPPYNNFGR